MFSVSLEQTDFNLLPWQQHGGLSNFKTLLNSLILLQRQTRKKWNQFILLKNDDYWCRAFTWIPNLQYTTNNRTTLSLFRKACDGQNNYVLCSKNKSSKLAKILIATLCFADCSSTTLLWWWTLIGNHCGNVVPCVVVSVNVQKDKDFFFIKKTVNK